LDIGNRKIKLNSLEFSNPPFRKLGNLKIDFADRITLIAGHNGIGKSTILGLLANTFGNAAKGAPKSYFGDAFYANIERIVYLALDEVAKAQENPSAAPVVVADVFGHLVKKRCSMTQRGVWKRARVVPRTIVDKDAVGTAPINIELPFGPDAKIPLPTIYLGVKRLASIGEAKEKDVISVGLAMHPDDSTFMAEFVNSVILGNQADTNVTHQSIKGSQKKTAQPGYKTYQALAVSTGQDSLGSIATALASFARLQRDLGDEYPGGLLVIDELDVGFHPHAVERLARALKSHAKRLSLQIVATTHSPRLIEAIHPEGDGHEKSSDSVVYLLDTKNPRLAEDQSLNAVLADMALRVDAVSARKVRKPKLCVYFEDQEGGQFCDALIPSAKRSKIGRANGVAIKFIPLGVGVSNLIQLPDHDPIFKDRVLIVDADTKIAKKYALRGNALKLPCPQGASGTDRSPENIVKNFLRDMASGFENLNLAMRRLSVTNPTSDKLSNTFLQDASSSSSERGSSKSWWQDHWSDLAQWGVLREWANCHKKEVAVFIKNFEAAVATTAQRLK
jgi:predicted ATPase